MNQEKTQKTIAATVKESDKMEAFPAEEDREELAWQEISTGAKKRFS